jgi:hypothetical protein
MADEDMSTKVSYLPEPDGPIEHEDIVVAATPQIRVYINGLGQLGINILRMNEDEYRLEQDLISIPIEYARTVAEAIIQTVEEFEEDQ